MGRRAYRFIDPAQIDTSDIMPVPGTNAECLSEALLDVIMVAQDSGMTEQDVDEAMRRVLDYLAGQERAKFRLLAGSPGLHGSTVHRREGSHGND